MATPNEAMGSVNANTRDVFCAIDLGAGSGRVLVAMFTDSGLVEEEITRFRYPLPTKQPDPPARLRWDFEHILKAIEDGLAAVGVWVRDQTLRETTWCYKASVLTLGVDYAFLNGQGERTELPVAYRDNRTEGQMDAVFGRLPRAEISRRTGIQFLPFNTLFQLSAEMAVRDSGVVDRQDRTFLMIPDLIAHHLCRRVAVEYTNATTTQLVNAETRDWDDGLIAAAGASRQWFPEIVMPGTSLGTLRSDLAARAWLAERCAGGGTGQPRHRECRTWCAFEAGLGIYLVGHMVSRGT